MTRAIAPVVALLGLCSGIAAASGPVAERRTFDPASFYEARCAYCHGPGGWGTRHLALRVPEGQAELLKRVSLPPALTKIAVRRGIGSMPQFTPAELTDAELEALAAWLEGRN